MQIGVQYPIGLVNCPPALQSKSTLTVHPKMGVTIFPVSWGTRQQVLFQATAAGTFDISLYWPDSTGTVQETEVSITVAGGPAPVNPPDPGPSATTVPAGRLWLIAVIPDVNQQTPAQGAILTSKDLHALLDSKGNHLRWVDPATAPADLAGWVTRAQSDGLPRLYLVDADPAGTAVKVSVPLPATAAAVVNLIQKWGGK
jgi:hypothetical protein